MDLVHPSVHRTRKVKCVTLPGQDTVGCLFFLKEMPLTDQPKFLVSGESCKSGRCDYS